MVYMLNLCDVAVFIFIVIIIYKFVRDIPERLAVLYRHAGVIFKAAARACPNGAIGHSANRNHTDSGKYGKQDRHHFIPLFLKQ